MKKVYFIVVPVLLTVLTVSAQVITPDLSPDPINSKILQIEKTELLKGNLHRDGLVFSYKTQEVEGKKLVTSYPLVIETPGNYFLTAHALGINDIPIDGVLADKNELKLQPIEVFIDGKSFGLLNLKKNGWQSAHVGQNNAVFLNSGRHVISFKSNMPYYPDIDVVKLSKSKNAAFFEEQPFLDYIQSLRDNGEKNRHNTTKYFDSKNEEATWENSLKSASNSSSSWEVTPYTLSNPAGNYKHKMNVPVVYTYYKKIYLNKGQNVVFHTTPIAGQTYHSVDPVMYLFAESNFQNAWVNDDYDGFHPRISVNIPQSGNYFLVLRAYSSSHASSSDGRQGLVNVYQNSNLLQSDAPVSGYMVSVGTSNTGTLNYFTGYSTGFPRLWLAPYGKLEPLQFEGERYWNVPPMDYNWFDDARFRIVKNTGSYLDMYMLVSSEGAWWVYWGNADVYGSCKQAGSGVVNAFPQLKANDAIQSAPSTNQYNCASWAGGLTRGWFWGCLSPNNQSSCNELFYGNPYAWSTWDNYFGNSPQRYAGATTYTRDQANSSNGDIAAWSTNGSIYGVTHFSIRLEGNKHPHGYDWESKPGGYERIFHPKNALQGSSYGQIFAYYKDIDKGNKALDEKFSFDQSINLGLTVLQDVKLSDSEKDLLNYKKGLLSTASIGSKYDKWIGKITEKEYLDNSNPNVFFRNSEFEDLLTYSTTHEDEAIIFLADKIFSLEGVSFECQFSSLFFCYLLKERYGNLMEEVKEEWKKNNYTEKGAYIAPDAIGNTKNYIKKILAKKYNLNKLKSGRVDDREKIVPDNHDYFSVAPNPVSSNTKIKLKIDKTANISLVLKNSQGKVVRVYVNNKKLQKGNYQYLLSANTLTTGLYLCILTTNNEILTRKLLVMN